MDRDIGHIETEMNRGFLQVLALVMLEKKTYGYQMVKALDVTGYRLEENTLYPLLRRFEKNGLVKSEWDVSEDRPKKYYVITPKGRALREKLLAFWRSQNDILKKILEVHGNV